MPTFSARAPRRAARVLLPVIAILLMIAGPAAGVYYARKISGVMKTPASSVGEAYYISPDGRYVVFTADREIDGAENVYSVPAAGGPAVRISNAATVGVEVYDLAISPDSSRVVFRADALTAGEMELFSVPIAGGTVTKLNAPLVHLGDVADFKIAPDSQSVLYLADQEVDGAFNLYYTPIDHSDVTRVNPDMDPSYDVNYDFAFHPGGLGIVYRADGFHEGVGVKERLYWKPLPSGAVRQLSDEEMDDGTVESFKITPDGNSVAYKANSGTSGAGAIWSMYASSLVNPAVRAVPMSSTTGPRAMRNFEITQNNVVAYIAQSLTEPDKMELYAAWFDGTGTLHTITLNDPLCAQCDVTDFQVAPNGTDVVYLVMDYTSGSASRLYSRTVRGGSPTVRQISAALIAGGEVAYFEITANSLGVIYTAQRYSTQYELFSVAITGGDSLQLSYPLAAGTDVRSPHVGPNSTSVEYIAHEAIDSGDALLVTAITHRQVDRLSRSIEVAGGGIESFIFSPDGKWVVYSSDATVLDQRELYLAKDSWMDYLPSVGK